MFDLKKKLYVRNFDLASPAVCPTFDSTDGLISAGVGDEIIVYDLKSSRLVQTLKSSGMGGKGTVRSVDWSPHTSSLLAAGYDSGCLVWDEEMAKARCSFSQIDGCLDARFSKVRPIFKRRVCVLPSIELLI